jgi:hypothetical protein
MTALRWRQDGERRQTIAIVRSTVTALRVWQEVQDTEPAFYGSDYHPGGYMFMRYR